MLRSCRTCRTGSKRPGKRAKPPRRVEIGATAFQKGGRDTQPGTMSPYRVNKGFSARAVWSISRFGYRAWTKSNGHRFYLWLIPVQLIAFGGSFIAIGLLPVLEKGEVRARALRPWGCGASGRWHIHCAI